MVRNLSYTYITQAIRFVYMQDSKGAVVVILLQTFDSEADGRSW